MPIDTRFVEFQERRAALTSRPQPQAPSDADGEAGSPTIEEQGVRHALVVPLTQARRDRTAKRQS